MGLFDFLAPEVNKGAQNQQTKLASKAAADTEEQRKKALKGQETGYNKAIALSSLGTDLFKGITDDRQQATDMYYNSLGLNGAEGNQAALGAYQQAPGFQFALDQANQNVMRNQASLGGLNSGQTLMDLSDRAQQLQNLDYGQWQDRLHGLDVLPAAQVYGTQLGNQGQLQVGKGNDMAHTRLGFAPQVAGNYNNQASLIGQQQSQQMAAQQQGIGNAIGLLGGISGFFGA